MTCSPDCIFFSIRIGRRCADPQPVGWGAKKKQANSPDGELVHMRPRGDRHNGRSRACSVNELLTVCEHGDLTVSSAVVLAQQTASARKAGAFLCVPSMIDSLGWKSSVQPDGGEGLAKRKDVVARRGLKEASPIGPPSDNPSGRRQQSQRGMNRNERNWNDRWHDAGPVCIPLVSGGVRATPGQDGAGERL
jgi:hypothetical protein